MFPLTRLRVVRSSNWISESSTVLQFHHDNTVYGAFDSHCDYYRIKRYRYITPNLSVIDSLQFIHIILASKITLGRVKINQ